MRHIIFIFLCLFSFAMTALPAFAEEPVKDPNIEAPADNKKTVNPAQSDLLKEEFVPISDPNSIPGLNDVIQDGNSLEGYLTLTYTLLITIGIVLAVILTVYHGFQYALTDILHTKRTAKEALTSIAIGLGLILGAYLILFTINPALVNFKFNANINTGTITPKVRDCENIFGGSFSKEQPRIEGVYIKYKIMCYDVESRETMAGDFYGTTRLEGYETMLDEEFGGEAAQAGVPLALYITDPKNNVESRLGNIRSKRCEDTIKQYDDPKNRMKGLVGVSCIYIMDKWGFTFSAKYEGYEIKNQIGVETLTPELCSKWLDGEWESDPKYKRTLAKAYATLRPMYDASWINWGKEVFLTMFYSQFATTIDEEQKQELERVSLILENGGGCVKLGRIGVVEDSQRNYPQTDSITK